MTQHAPAVKFGDTTYVEDTATSTLNPKYADAVSIGKMDGPSLLDLYNRVADRLTIARDAGVARVKRFSDRSAATRRTWAILQDYAAQDDGFEMTADELEAQSARVKREDIEHSDVTVTPKVQLSDADRAQVADEAASRQAVTAERMIQRAAADGAQARLRQSPPASTDAAKDAEMPALRRAARALDLAPKNKVYPRRAGSKQAILVDLLSRPQGATFGELYDAMAATGKPWRGVTIRSGLAWDINHITGYGVRAEMLNGEEFAAQGRAYEAKRLGMVLVPEGTEVRSGVLDADLWTKSEGYDPQLRLAVYRLTYPAGMDAPLAHVGAAK